ncbi:MAG: PilX N-terminal domain-containing pilus assembly protein [Nitrincola lacisaponensis]|uniref:pilus assembly PilX family protein n=1 Tax=Nitrincola lacisaponensis TaxID=267850 RepID=UPI0039187450
MWIKHPRMTGNALIMTLVFLSVITLLTFSAAVNSQLQQRMSHQLWLKMQADQAADAGVAAFYHWLHDDPEHWQAEGWPASGQVNAEIDSYYQIPESELQWQSDRVTLTVEGLIQRESETLSQSRLRVTFLHSIDTGRIHLDQWVELQ